MALGDKLAGNASASAVKAGEAFFEVNADDKNVMSSLKRLANRVNSLGGFLKNTGLGLAGVGASVLGPLTGLFALAVKEADDLNDLADRFDSTAESISTLGYAAKLSGASIEDVLASTKALNMAMIQANDGNAEAVVLFEQLGVTAEEFADVQLEDKFRLIAGAAEQIDDPIAKAKFTMGLLGKQAITLAPLLANGADGLEELYKKAELFGAVKTTEQMKEAGKLADMWDNALISVKSTILEIGYALFGVSDSAEAGTNSMFKTLKTIRDWIKGNRETVSTIAMVAGGVIALGGTLAIAGTALSGMVAGLVAIKTAGLAVLTVVLSPTILTLAVFTAAVAGAVYAFTTFTESGKLLKRVFNDTFNSIWETFKLTFGGIVDSLKSGNIKQAGEIAALGLQVAWEEANLAILKGQRDTGASVSTIWADVLSGAETMWTDFTSYLAKAWMGLTGIIAYGLGSLSDELGITSGKAQKVADRVNEQVKMLAEAQKEANAATLDANVKRNQELGLAREKDIKKAEGRLNDLKNRLRELADKAARDNMDFGGGGDFGEFGAGHRDFGAMATLGDAVRGTFGSADYRGSLGIGPANDYAKKSNDELKAIKAELVKLNKKQGLAFD